MATRNPKWARDELILALDLYKRLEGQDPPRGHPEVLALSEILNALPIHQERPDTDRFRNENGVRMKLMNFRRFDPDFEGSGLSAGGRGEEDIWEEFAGDANASTPRVAFSIDFIDSASGPLAWSGTRSVVS